MNRWQFLVVLLTLTAVGVAYVFPPYLIDGAFMSGTSYYFFRNPPSASESASHNDNIVFLEMRCIGFSFWAAWFALRSEAKRRQAATFLVGFTLELLFLVGSAPSFRIVLAVEFIWLVLNAFSILMVATIMLLGWRRTKHRNTARSDS